MAYFRTKNFNLGRFGRDLQWKMLVDFLDIRLFWPLVVAIWYILLLFGIHFPVLVYRTKTKSGNPN
jgi:hypothetical protein